jgi:hypothetical protein
MSAQHTPGPWTLTHVGGSNFAVQTFEVRGMFGDKPNVYPIFNRNSSSIDGGVIHTSPENACLIAAAPDLLEALEAFVARLGNVSGTGNSGLCETVRNAKAAIAKATTPLLMGEGE